MKFITLPLMITGAFIASIIDPGTPTTKTKILVDNSRLTYNLNDKNKLDGAYFVENTKRSVWLRGAYKEDQRTGNWYAFNNDQSIFIRYNYDLKKLLYIDTVALKKAEITITDKNIEAVNNASVPLPVCSIDQLTSLLVESAKSGFPKDNLIYNKPFPVTITAKVKSASDVTYTVTYKEKGFDYAYEINKKDMDFNIDWIPSTYNGKNVESEFKINTMMEISSDVSGTKRFKWNY